MGRKRDPGRSVRLNSTPSNANLLTNPQKRIHHKSKHRYQLATGGSENVAKLWDVRKKQNTYTLPAHSGLISSLKCVSVVGGGCGSVRTPPRSPATGRNDKNAP